MNDNRNLSCEVDTMKKWGWSHNKKHMPRGGHLFLKKNSTTLKNARHETK